MRYSTAILVLGLMMGCNDSGHQMRNEKPGMPGESRWFQYTGFNEQGNVLVRGYLKLVLPEIDGGGVSGQWKLEPADEGILADDFVWRYGPQAGEGEIDGRLHAGRMTVVLLPRAIDNEIYIILDEQEEGWSGRWEHHTDAGITAQGRVQMRFEPGGEAVMGVTTDDATDTGRLR